MPLTRLLFHTLEEQRLRGARTSLLRLLILGALAALTACSDGVSGCQRGIEQTLSYSSPLTRAPRGLELIPVDSNLLIAFKTAEVAALIDSPWIQDVDLSMAQLLAVDVLAMCHDSERVLGTSMCDTAFQTALGVKPRQPLLVAHYRDHWIWVFDSTLSLDDPGSRPASLPGLGVNLEASPEHPHLVHLISRTHPDGAWLAHHNDLYALVLPSSSADAATTRQLARSLSDLKRTAQWRALPAHRELYDTLARHAELIVIGDIKPLTSSLEPASKLSHRQYVRLLAQLDHLGIGLWRSPTALNRLEGELRVSTSVEEAVLVRALDPSKATLPSMLGALLSEQALGVLHAAVDPRSVLNMVRSGFDMAQREEFDRYLDHLKQELMLDLDIALFDNLTGQALLVIYDVQPGEQVESSGPSILGLDATHELLYLPLKDRFALEQMLNAITQLTRGALRRQTEDGVIQYVWIAEGELLGAVLLGEDAVVIVDSAVSVKHAMNHLLAPHALDPKLAARFARLSSSTKGFGIWVEPSAFAARFPPRLGAMFRGMEEVSMSSYDQDPNTNASMGASFSVTLATEAFDEPVATEP